MYSKFCSVKQLEALLNVEKVKGYKIEITQRATFQLLIWIEDYNLVNEIEYIIEKKSFNLEYDKDQKFIESIEFISDDEVENNEDLKNELLKHYVETSIYPHLNSWIGKRLQSSRNLNSPVVTFYSYKGGVGRSTALAITARQLSEIKNKKVVVLDFDLEAPGQYYLFNNDKNYSNYGIADYLRHQLYLERELTEAELSNYYTKIQKSKNSGEIYLFNPYGNGKNYLEDIAYVDFDMFVRSNRNYVDIFLQNIDKVIKPDVILIDCRTGFSEISGIFVNNSDLISVFLGFSGQNDFGIETILECYAKNNQQTLLYAPNYIFNFSVLPEEKNEDDYDITRGKLIDGTYKIVKKVFRDRLNEPDFGENSLNFNFIYRHKLLEDNNSKNIDDFSAIELKELNDLTDLDKLIHSNEFYSASLRPVGNSFELKLLKNRDLKDYSLIINKIEDLINLKSSSKTIFNSEDISKILKEINFKSNIKYYTKEKFKDIFLFNDNCNESKNKSIIVGKKGTGKTSLLHWYIYSSKNNVKFKSIIAFNYADDLDYSNQTLDYWEEFWNKKSLEYLNNELSSSKGSKFADFNEITSLDYKPIYLLYDDLDKLLELNKYNVNCILGLLTFWKKYENIKNKISPKIFLNEYIFNMLFQDKQNVIYHYLETNDVYDMKWTFDDTKNMIIKRAVVSSKFLRDFINKNSRFKNSLKSYLKNSFDEKVEEIPSTNNNHIFELIVGNKLNEDMVTSSDMRKWFKDYFSDYFKSYSNFYTIKNFDISSDSFSPKDILFFFEKINELSLSKFRDYYKEKSMRLYPMNLFCIKEIYNSIAEEKLKLIYEEFNSNKELCKFLNALQNIPDIEFPINRDSFILKINNEDSSISNNDIKNSIELSIRLGIFDLSKSGVDLYMKPIYLQAFNKKSSNYNFM